MLRNLAKDLVRRKSASGGKAPVLRAAESGACIAIPLGTTGAVAAASPLMLATGFRLDGGPILGSSDRTYSTSKYVK